MRIAVLSDIHGNLPALEAVAADLEQHAPDQVWCGGDVCFGGPWAKECIEWVRDAGWTTVKGNTDVWATGDAQGLPADADEAAQMSEMIRDVAAAHQLSDEDVSWLLNLPLGHKSPGGLLLVHGTPDTPFDAPMPDAPAAAFAPYEGQATIVLYGHVHHAFMRRLAEGTLVLNPGSVGLPLDDDTASYLIVDRDAADLTFRHRRVPFDREAAASEARRAPDAITSWFLGKLEG